MQQFIINQKESQSGKRFGVEEEKKKNILLWGFLNLQGSEIQLNALQRYKTSNISFPLPININPFL